MNPHLNIVQAVRSSAMFSIDTATGNDKVVVINAAWGLDAGLLGGKQFEPQEENPMLGFRGACRYYSPDYQPVLHLNAERSNNSARRWGLTMLL